MMTALPFSGSIFRRIPENETEWERQRNPCGALPGNGCEACVIYD